LVKIIRRLKVTNFPWGNKNFSRQSFYNLDPSKRENLYTPKFVPLRYIFQAYNTLVTKA